MTYRLTQRGSVSRQLARIVKAELAQALGRLGTDIPDEDAVHEARKSVKKVRAVLRLVRSPISRTHRRTRARLRRAAHALAAIRDADASAETLKLLEQSFPSAVTAAVVKEIARGLGERRQEVRANAGEDAMQATRALRRAAGSAPRAVRTAGRRQVRRGIVRGYRRARVACRNLGPDAEPSQFHLWRRRLKDHWYHMRLVEGLHPAPRARARSLNRLETLLGDDHNLALLRAIILTRPDRYGPVRATAVVLGSIARRQRELRAAALALGHELFAATPAEFREAMAAWWRPG